jgi:hypothetical protein
MTRDHLYEVIGLVATNETQVSKEEHQWKSTKRSTPPARCGD